MERRTVAVEAVVVGISRREMDQAGDFFVEQSVHHRLRYEGVHAESEFSGEAGAVAFYGRQVFDRDMDLFPDVAVVEIHFVAGNIGKGESVATRRKTADSGRIIDEYIGQFSDSRICHTA